MSDGNSSTELPQIEFVKERTSISEHERVYIQVRGQSLVECRKHLDEIRETVL